MGRKKRKRDRGDAKNQKRRVMMEKNQNYIQVAVDFSVIRVIYQISKYELINERESH